ncbi:BT4734/BF3469 family protein [Spirosoma flavum]|uniref:BT4734/BF3469 family protein n=1 Tax=Spirosoma flavum TaxID=2048557 RepID=A0ABW6ATS1_9BACT
MSKPILNVEHQPISSVTHANVSFFGKGSINQPLKQSVDTQTLNKRIQSGTYKTQTENLRKKKLASQQEILAYESQHCSSVTFSGIFSPTRAVEHLIQHSGFICIHLDQLKPKRLKALLTLLKANPFTCLLFVSPDGNGLRVVVKIDCHKAQDHGAFFDQLVSYYQTHLGIEATELNESGKDICQLSFLSYDPEIYYDADSLCTKLGETSQTDTMLGDSTNQDLTEVENTKLAKPIFNSSEVDLNTLQTDQDNVTIPVAIGKPNDLNEYSPNKQLNRLLTNEQLIRRSAEKEVVFDEPLIKWQDTPIIHKCTINTIQGKTGQSKSAAAQMFTSILIGKADCDDQGEAKRFQRLLDQITVCYIDTERAIKTEFAFAIQSILINAGYDPTEEVDNFRYTSIKSEKRKDRLEAIRKFIQYVRNSTTNHLFVILDVVTDCLDNFNDLSQTMKLTDFLGNLCEQFNATVLLVIHENPGTDKARGHTGTEIFNKSTTQMQISIDKSISGDDLYNLHFKKVRSGKKPDDIYLTRNSRGLFLADQECASSTDSSPMQKEDLAGIAHYLESVLKEGPTVKGDVYKMLMTKFPFGRSTAQLRVKKLIEQGTEMKNATGLRAVLNADQKHFFLEVLDE